MSLPFPVNIAAECLWTGCCILGDNKSIYGLKPTGFFLLSQSVEVVKGKVIPFQAWAGPEGSRRLMLPDFKTIDT
jgi:hypothetical protein